jgi:hypothetical protein
MTVETATSIPQLDTTLPTSADLISEGDNHLRLIKTVLKTQFPNIGTAAMTATAAELSFSVGLSASITSLLAAKGAIAGQVWTGTHDFSGATEARAPTVAAGDNSTKVATTAYVASVALSTALPGQAGQSGKIITTDGTTANWSDTINGNLYFAGTARRIGIKNGGATPSDDLLLEATSLNSATSVGAMPNGVILAPGAVASEFAVYNTNPAVDYSYGKFVMRQNDSVRIEVGKAGTGTALPFHIDQAGVTRFSISDTLGRVGINRAVPTHLFHIDSAYIGGLPSPSNVSPDRNVITRFQNTGVAVDVGADNAATGWVQARSQSNNATYLPLLLNPNGGQVLAGVGGFGYGPSSIGTGGTVTQATSRSTAVTINKPAGAITMFTAAGSATVATFRVNNSIVSANDAVLLSIRAGATNIYAVSAINVSAGFFDISFYSLSGTASDAPVINFVVIKGATT